jgi:hypothetical protein
MEEPAAINEEIITVNPPANQQIVPFDFNTYLSGLLPAYIEHRSKFITAFYHHSI